jgi:hypothetical protein
MQRAVVKTSTGISVLSGALVAYVLLLRPRLLIWGATSQERLMALPGDELVS